jgi:hypothetical protein
MKKKPKLSKAVRDIVTAFHALSPTDDAEVLRQLGLQRDPLAVAAAAERERQELSRVMASSSSGFDLADFEAPPGEQGIGLPHPDLMTTEEKAIWYPKRSKPQGGGQQEKAPKAGGLRDPG